MRNLLILALLAMAGQAGAEMFDCSKMPICSKENYNTAAICRVPGVTPALCTHRTDVGNFLVWAQPERNPVYACRALGPGWQLPSFEELKILMRHRHEIGGFAEDRLYWASSPSKDYSSNCLRTDPLFDAGKDEYCEETRSLHARCIRRL
jgi:hypothetical protein